MSGKTVWTFTVSGVDYTWYRALSGSEFEPWFSAEGQYTVDGVLGALVAADNYLDIGGVTVPPLSLRAAFASSSYRETLRSACLLQTGTLSNTRGRSATATLLVAKRVDDLPMFYLDMQFIMR